MREINLVKDPAKGGKHCFCEDLFKLGAEDGRVCGHIVSPTGFLNDPTKILHVKILIDDSETKK